MKPWTQGDPVACGEVYLPDKDARAAYGQACRDLWIDPAARHALRLPTVEARRAFIASYPQGAQDALKNRIKELWAQRSATPTA